MTAQGRQPLWTNDDIKIMAFNAVTEYFMQGEVKEQPLTKLVFGALLPFRDDYEARIAELEARLASAWEPLPDGTYHTDGPGLIAIEGTALTVYTGGGGAEVTMPQGYAICHRVAKE